jgi:hypothetical protein
MDIVSWVPLGLGRDRTARSKTLEEGACIMAASSEQGAVRDSILDVLAASSLSGREQIATLVQCTSYCQHLRMLEKAAQLCGTQIAELMHDDVLELYCELVSSGRDDCSVSKGWDEPGFRFTQTVLVSPSAIPLIKHNDELFRYCAARGVALSFEERDGLLEVGLDSVVYEDGFNERVLAQVIKYLDVCREEVEKVAG